MQDVEIARGKALGYSNIPTTRPGWPPPTSGPARSPVHPPGIERFGLRINKVDTFQLFFAGELPLVRVQPYRRARRRPTSR